MDPIELQPLGDRAFLAHFPTERDAADWAAAVRQRRGRGVTDVVLAYRAVAVFADPEQVELLELESRLRAIAPVAGTDCRGQRVRIPVLYDGADLDAVAARRNLSRAEVIDLHGGVEYDVFAIGFLPGFPYAGYLPAALSGLPRRAAPRLRVPAGSVGIAGRQTGIYPRESPGGWHLLGRTPLCIADPDEGYFPIRAGDRLQFVAISVAEFEARRDERL
ncbi:MAG TPA: 5-oxoprolinase subunit PxpB [Isosphaeraceae bacterium]|nr:5-oxoprolinase subunit PxpB [Isosphaeraceae bacterium]